MGEPNGHGLEVAGREVLDCERARDGRSLAIGYRLPRRLGIVTVEVNNLFDRAFRYQDVVRGSNSESYPSILPERVLYTRLTLLF